MGDAARVVAKCDQRHDMDGAHLMMEMDPNVDMAGIASPPPLLVARLQVVRRALFFYGRLLGSSSPDWMSPGYYYHYTSRENLWKILKSGVIHASTDGMRDASMGPGVYLTRRPPKTPDHKLSWNNYDDSANRNDPRLEAFVALPVKALPSVRCLKQGRDVCFYPSDSELNIQDIEFTYGVRRSKSMRRNGLRATTMTKKAV